MLQVYCFFFPCRTAVEGNLLDEQILALENMHYSYMIRFDDVEKARLVNIDLSILSRIFFEIYILC